MKFYFKLLIPILIFKIINCQSCALGSYFSNNNCYLCPNGYYCPSGATKPIACPLGTFSYSSGGISECKPCSLGYYANNVASTGCRACPDGYQCCDPKKDPTPCPLGTYSSSNGGISECIPCYLGYYTNKTASTSCRACPDGYQCCDPKSAPSPCPVGTYSISTGGIAQCTQCYLGYYADTLARTSCRACPDGYQCCDPRISPTPCPLGTYSYSSGGISECKSCGNGYYTDTLASTGCKYCPNGNSCQSPVNAQQCSPVENLADSCTRNINAEKDQLKCTQSNSIKDLDYLTSVGDCEFYQELENEKKCGTNGYLSRYGFKYCKKFGENIDSFNKEGQKWVDGVRMCLMKKLLNSDISNCNELESFAFDTHVDCYLNPGHGAKSMCELLQMQNFIGLWNVYDFKDFLSINAIKQVVSVMSNCGSQLISNGINSVNNNFNSLLDSLNLLTDS
ncbi:unnamed protein product [Brachionus calyciflorus]|uniref:Tyrosine-protein kinase ephrin type A/B receptor-like domain-containing protein n=1 Tax=Brachionus calyciflorus TaxID=104777 RepID=A0A814LI18_9BILA|nr:unnamed protein product [Brachionus calyciflorus]